VDTDMRAPRFHERLQYRHPLSTNEKKSSSARPDPSFSHGQLREPSADDSNSREAQRGIGKIRRRIFGECRGLISRKEPENRYSLGISAKSGPENIIFSRFSSCPHT